MNKPNEKVNNRIEWIDACKGFAIILVILGHIADGYLGAKTFPANKGVLQAIYNCMYAFHMPLFFFLSGFLFCKAYCMNTKNIKSRFSKQCLNIVWIYLIFSVVQWCFKMYFADSVNKSFSVRDLELILIKPMKPYWYLYVLFFYYIIYHLCYKKIRTDILVIASFIIGIAGSFITVKLIFPVYELTYYAVFFALGMYYADSEKVRALTVKFFNKYIYLLILVLISISTLVYTAYNGLASNYPVKFLTAFICMVTTILVFENIIMLGRNKFFELCGRYSLEIYVIHCFITAGNRVILPKLGITYFALAFIINLIMAIFIPILISLVLKKLKLYKILYKPASYLKIRE